MKGDRVRLKKARKKARTGSASSARGLALEALNRWEARAPDEREPIDALAGLEIARHAGVGARDRRLFRAIFYGVIRHRLLLDFILDSFLERPSKVPPEARNILRSALFQLLFMDRVPASAAVNEAVNLAGATGLAWARGLVNGVLRRIKREDEKRGGLLAKWLPGQRFGNSNEFLSISTSHPEWMVKRWSARLGEESSGELCRANNKRAPFTLRVNTLLWNREDAMKFLEENRITARACQYSPDAIEVISFRKAPADLPGFRQGGFQVQDEASQLVSFMVAPEPGMKVLDLCAGSGGKTTHLAALSEDRALITATDKNRERLALLRDNLKRLKLHSVNVADFRQVMNNAGRHSFSFDRVLVDAPCSGLGVIRRRPDIKWNRGPDDIERLAALQLELLETAAAMCRAGGTVVYAVCSFEKEETCGVISSFLAKHGEWEVKDAAGLLPGRAASLAEDGSLLALPWRHGTDGFFAAALSRKNDSSQVKTLKPPA